MARPLVHQTTNRRVSSHVHYIASVENSFLFLAIFFMWLMAEEEEKEMAE